MMFRDVVFGYASIWSLDAIFWLTLFYLWKKKISSVFPEPIWLWFFKNFSSLFVCKWSCSSRQSFSLLDGHWGRWVQRRPAYPVTNACSLPLYFISYFMFWHFMALQFGIMHMALTWAVSRSTPLLAKKQKFCSWWNPLLWRGWLESNRCKLPIADGKIDSNFKFWSAGSDESIFALYLIQMMVISKMAPGDGFLHSFLWARGEHDDYIHALVAYLDVSFKNDRLFYRFISLPL